MRIEYQPGTSLLHRLDVRAKLLLFALAVAATFLFGHWLPNLLMTLVALGLLLASGARWREIGRLVAPLGFVLVFIVAFAAFGYNADGAADPAHRVVLLALLPGGGLPLTVGGLYYGLSLGLRILTMVMLTTLLLRCTPIEHFVAAMREARVPHPIVFIVMTALRFIPTMQHRADQVLDAQRARGAKVDRGGLIGRVRAYIPIMVPLITSGVRMSEDLAAAMLNRGYGATRCPTALLELHAARRDAVAASAGVLVLAALVVLRVLGWGAL
jgi:energy-coupling factor transporter transmembrane protein EcfT